MKKQGKKLTFKQKVQSMSAKEIIMAMVEGLRNPTTDFVDMSTWGHLNEENVCFGCAATNTVCRIAGKNYEYYNSYRKLSSIDEDYDFVNEFERAINLLRQGLVDHYNTEAKKIGIAQIDYAGFPKPLPYLATKDYLDCLDVYVELAEFQDAICIAE
jgi:hypothetical protein